MRRLPGLAAQASSGLGITLFAAAVLAAASAAAAVAGTAAPGAEAGEATPDTSIVYTTDDMVVSATRVTSTDAAVLSVRQQALTIGDVISAEQIRRSPDATGGDALKRVTGLSIVDNKYVFVRGVTDRYNGTLLNGIPVTSADIESDRKSFAYDLLPANLLDNTVVVKTGSPDLPGDFSGGLVKLTMLDFPAYETLKVSVGGSQVAGATGEQMLTTRGGRSDWLGMDDGGREFPEGDLKGAAMAQALPNSWAPRARQAGANPSLSATYGNRYLVAGRNEIGIVAALSYKHDEDVGDLRNARVFFLPGIGEYPIFDFRGTRSSTRVLWGGLLNLNARIALHHKLSFRNNYNQSAVDRVSRSSGLDELDSNVQRTTLVWNERSLWLTQLAGEHELPAFGGLRLDWRLFRSGAEADQPDRKHVEYANGLLRDNYRTWSTLSEYGDGVGADLGLPFGGATLKGGLLAQMRERRYGIQAWSADQAYLDGEHTYLVTLPLEEIFAPENFGPGLFRFIPVTTFAGEYTGKHRLNAWYGMLDAPARFLGQHIRLSGGARLENSEQLVETVAAVDDPTPITTRVRKDDTLPSVNFTWSPLPAVNARAAWFRSVNRPEFREMANVLWYDFERMQNVIGNPHLRRATVENLDLRLEVFPAPGEVLAISWFDKEIEDAIEEALLPAPTRYVRTWFNSPHGRNSGYEIEMRKNLGSLWGPLASLTVSGNYTHVASEIDYTHKETLPGGTHLIETRTRLMQGQAPWSLNVGLAWDRPDWGTNLNLLLNKVARRLDAVGETRDEDVFEEPRDLLDLALTQRLTESLQAKLAIRNLGAEDEVLTIGPDALPFSRLERGSSYSLSLSLEM